MNDHTTITTRLAKPVSTRNSRASNAVIEELLVTVEALREENRALRQRQESLAAERSAFAQRNDQVRARVEAMIGRLKTMEHTA